MTRDTWHGLVADPRHGRLPLLLLVLTVVTGVVDAVSILALAVPDLTTTVLTMTLTGIAADLRSRKGSGAIGRRVLAVLTMFGGAVVGALLVLHVSVPAALGLAVGLLALASALAWTTPRRVGS